MRIVRRLLCVSVPAAVATGALVVGAADVLATLAPGVVRTHVQPLAAMLPAGTPSVARSVTFAAGTALIWVAAGLGRGKRRAWYLAVALVVLGAAAHLVRGFDLEQATLSAAFLAVLIGTRRHFDVSGEPTSMRPVAGALLA